ncbi:CLUMA_CG019844, isoform A [Clunio marinus]|nr:CLUMA_CG019844, isoform A [Clunio marinus]
MKIPFDESLYTTAVDFDDGCLDVSKHQASDVNSSLVIPEMDLESNNGDSLDSSLDSSLVIPEMDLESDNGDSLDSSLDSSFEIPEINFESDYEDNSIISHW